MAPLKILIAGGGIAGLSAAVGLRRAGHEVHVYERSALNNEIGAAIHVCPNAARALLAWGLDPVKAKFVVVKCSFRAKGDTLEKFHVGTEDYIEERYGAPWYFAHRVDLHEELKRLATEPGDSPVHSPGKLDGMAANGVNEHGKPSSGPGKPVIVHLRSEVVAYADPVTRFWNEGDDGRIKFLVGDTKRLVSYPCRKRNAVTDLASNEIHNFVAIFQNEDIESTKKEDWHASVSKDKLLERYSDFHPSVLAILDKATDVKQWALLYRAPIPTWTKGKLTLAGDAAHPMLPHQGQGGAQGIEDGVALGIALAGAETKDVESRLRIYEAIRRNRASVMQIFSNAGQEEPELIREEAAKYIPAENVPKNPEEFFAYNFGYDIIRDSVQQLQKADPSFSLPPSFFQKEPVKGVYP
ncbi:3-hydroxybenzoate 6-hydroxylase 1 [Colletotrichum liriopes]|uniref:3-hydroxybenzoate 6-hydroxylase 1 n=1 Tax=Colletotrichum liriopes TaxID=708192 RepID=A0AA37GN05_9PEZI|nr:3-hydroxybenzoate 6-hydroxylase 1 [Colletotrichum liriopes]